MRKALLAPLLVCLLAALRLQVYADQNITVSIIAPKNGSYVYPDFELRWSESGEGNRTEIYLDGSFITYLKPAVGSYYFEGLANGSRQIIVRAIGTNNESAEDIIVVTVLTASADIAILSPNDGFFTNSSSVVITWNATGPIRQLRFSSSDLSEVVLDEGLRSYNLTLVTEGEVKVRLAAIDLRGTTITRTMTLIHDSSPPICEVISPQDGQVIYQSVVLAQWSVHDVVGNISKAEVYIDGAVSSNLTAGEKLLTDLADGEHTLRIVSFDAADNRGEVIARFTISVPFLARYGLIVGLVIVVGVGLILPLSVRRTGIRRSKR